MADDKNVRCWTCYGEGVTSGEQGLRSCPDCGGVGRLPSPPVLTESRLREIERVYGDQGQAAQDVGWLVAEVRRAQHALTQILAASQDADPADATASRIKFLANDVLGMYPKKPL
jgi:hypothetical protein